MSVCLHFLPIIKRCAELQCMRLRDIPCSSTSRSYLTKLEYKESCNFRISTLCDLCQGVHCTLYDLVLAAEKWQYASAGRDELAIIHNLLAGFRHSPHRSGMSASDVLSKVPVALSQLRHMKQISLRVLEDSTGIDHSNIIHREQGILHDPSVSTLERLLQGMGCTFMEFFTGLEDITYSRFGT